MLPRLYVSVLSSGVFFCDAPHLATSDKKCCARVGDGTLDFSKKIYYLCSINLLRPNNYGT